MDNLQDEYEPSLAILASAVDGDGDVAQYLETVDNLVDGRSSSAVNVASGAGDVFERVELHHVGRNSTNEFGKRGNDSRSSVEEEDEQRGVKRAREDLAERDMYGFGNPPFCSFELYRIVFQILGRCESVDALPFHFLRNEVATCQTIGEREDVSDEVLARIIDDYRVVQQQRDKRAVTSSILKYSKSETEIILTIVRSYILENSLTPEDICPALRPDSDHLKGAKKELVRKLFDHLHSLLPYRQRDTLKFFVERKIFLTVHQLRGRWTDEEKNRLLSLYEVHGPRWAKLGRELGKRHEDVRMVHKQLMSVKKGKYTSEEESRLIAAIRGVLGKLDCPVSDIPYLGISWQSVAKLMNNERNSVEYQIK